MSRVMPAPVKVVAAVLATAGLWGCASPGAASRAATASSPAMVQQHIHVVLPERPQTTNSVCPITGMPVNSDKLVAVHRGQRVGFCAPECIAAWNILTLAERDRLLTMGERNRRRVWRLGPR